MWVWVSRNHHFSETQPPKIARETWVNFINILQAAVTHADPEIAKKLLDLTVFFALLVSALLKAARRMLVKLTPVNMLIRIGKFHFFFS